MSLATEMEVLFGAIVEAVTDDPRTIEVICHQEGLNLNVEIYPSAADYGPLRGKDERMIKALRTLAKAWGAACGHSLHVYLVSPRTQRKRVEQVDMGAHRTITVQRKPRRNTGRGILRDLAVITAKR